MFLHSWKDFGAEGSTTPETHRIRHPRRIEDVAQPDILVASFLEAMAVAAGFLDLLRR